MVTVPLASFRPDKAKFNTNALAAVNNVVPAADGWKPLKSIVRTPAVYDYLTDEFGNRLTDELGNRLVVAPDWTGLAGAALLPEAATSMFVARKQDGSEVLFAGTQTKLCKFDLASFTWVDVSSVPYSCVVPWVMVQFGDLVLAQNGFNAEQKFNVETDTEFSDNATAPICRTMAVVGSFVFRGYIVNWAGQGIANDPRMIMCSAFEDPTDNEPQNANFCDYQTFPTGTEVKTIVPFAEGCIVEMKDDNPYSVNVVMSDYTFTTAPINGSRGTPAPYSVGIIGKSDYLVYRDDGFWRISAGGVQPIGNEAVNATFLADCDQEQRESIRACVDPENLICWFAYTSVDGSRKMMGYHYVLGEFTMSDLDVKVSAQARTFAYGSSIITANLLRFAVITEDGQLGYLVGEPAEASFGTNETLHNPVSRAFVNGLKLVSDAGYYSVIVTTRDVLGGDFRSRPASTPSERTGFAPIRADGRAHQYDFSIPAGTQWTTAVAAEVDVKPSGR